MDNLQDKISGGKKIMLTALILQTIRTNANSLMGQLREYDFLYVTVQEYNQLNDLGRQLHTLVNKITERTD